MVYIVESICWRHFVPVYGPYLRLDLYSRCFGWGRGEVDYFFFLGPNIWNLPKSHSVNPRDLQSKKVHIILYFGLIGISIKIVFIRYRTSLLTSLLVNNFNFHLPPLLVILSLESRIGSSTSNFRVRGNKVLLTRVSNSMWFWNGELVFIIHVYSSYVRVNLRSVFHIKSTWTLFYAYIFSVIDQRHLSLSKLDVLLFPFFSLFPRSSFPIGFLCLVWPRKRLISFNTISVSLQYLFLTPGLS